MVEPIVYIDRSDIRPGKLSEVRAAIGDLTEFVETHIPQLITYGFYISDDETEMTVIALHRDSESMAYHLDTGSSAFRKMGEFIRLRSIEVYGRPSDEVMSRLHKKAEMLGEGEARVLVHHHHAGFSRIPSGVV